MGMMHNNPVFEQPVPVDAYIGSHKRAAGFAGMRYHDNLLQLDDAQVGVVYDLLQLPRPAKCMLQPLQGRLDMFLNRYVPSAAAELGSMGEAHPMLEESLAYLLSALVDTMMEEALDTSASLAQNEVPEAERAVLAWAEPAKRGRALRIKDFAGMKPMRWSPYVDPSTGLREEAEYEDMSAFFSRPTIRRKGVMANNGYDVALHAQSGEYDFALPQDETTYDLAAKTGGDVYDVGARLHEPLQGFDEAPYYMASPEATYTVASPEVTYSTATPQHGHDDDRRYSYASDVYSQRGSNPYLNNTDDYEQANYGMPLYDDHDDDYDDASTLRVPQPNLDDDYDNMVNAHQASEPQHLQQASRPIEVRPGSVRYSKRDSTADSAEI